MPPVYSGRRCDRSLSHPACQCRKKSASELLSSMISILLRRMTALESRSKLKGQFKKVINGSDTSFLYTLAPPPPPRAPFKIFARAAVPLS